MSQCSQGGLYQSNCIRLTSGEHHGLGAGVSKVRSLKMDRKVWTEALILVGVTCGLSMPGVGVPCGLSMPGVGVPCRSSMPGVGMP